MPRLIHTSGLPRTANRRTVCLCVKCGKYRPREHFYKNRLTPSGTTSYCKECYRTYYQTRKGVRGQHA